MPEGGFDMYAAAIAKKALRIRPRFLWREVGGDKIADSAPAVGAWQLPRFAKRNPAKDLRRKRSKLQEMCRKRQEC